MLDSQQTSYLLGGNKLVLPGTLQRVRISALVLWMVLVDVLIVLVDGFKRV